MNPPTAKAKVPAKQYEFHPVVGHTKLKPVVLPSIAAFDYFWGQVRPHLSNWAVWSDTKAATQYVGFLESITPERVSEIAKEVLDKLS